MKVKNWRPPDLLFRKHCFQKFWFENRMILRKIPAVCVLVVTWESWQHWSHLLLWHLWAGWSSSLTTPFRVAPSGRPANVCPPRSPLPAVPAVEFPWVAAGGWQQGDCVLWEGLWPPPGWVGKEMELGKALWRRECLAVIVTTQKGNTCSGQRNSVRADHNALSRGQRENALKLPFLCAK